MTMQIELDTSVARGFRVSQSSAIGAAIAAQAPATPAAGSRFSDCETIAGALDGANRVFVLARTPYPALSLFLFWNNSYQVQGLNYTLSGRNVTMAVGLAPAVGDTLRAHFRY